MAVLTQNDRAIRDARLRGIEPAGSHSFELIRSDLAADVIDDVESNGSRETG